MRQPKKPTQSILVYRRTFGTVVDDWREERLHKAKWCSKNRGCGGAILMMTELATELGWHQHNK
jgi:hypothetical protein